MDPVLIVTTDIVRPNSGAVDVLVEGAVGVADYASGTDSAELLASLGPKDSPLVRDASEMCRVTRSPLGYWRTTQTVDPTMIAAKLSVWSRDMRMWTLLGHPTDASRPHPYWHWSELRKERTVVASIPEVANRMKRLPVAPSSLKLKVAVAGAATAGAGAGAAGAGAAGAGAGAGAGAAKYSKRKRD
jgi:hypothetical protein